MINKIRPLFIISSLFIVLSYASLISASPFNDPQQEEKKNHWQILPDDQKNQIWGHLVWKDVKSSWLVCDDWNKHLPMSILNLDLKYLSFAKDIDKGLSLFSNLTGLDLTQDEGRMPNVFFNSDMKKFNFITDQGVSNLTNLISLNLTSNREITDSGVQLLTQLKSLNLTGNQVISNTRLKNLTSLTDLTLGYYNITDEGIKYLTNLTVLKANNRITDEGIKNLSSLTDLSLADNSKITDEGIKNLTNLTVLIANNRITDEGIKLLTSLQTLELPADHQISQKKLTELCKSGVECFLIRMYKFSVFKERIRS